MAHLLACGDEAASPPPESPESTPVVEGEPVLLDLIEHFPVARVEAPLRSIRFQETDLPYLTSGWHAIEEEKGRRFSWTKGRNAVVDISLAHRGDLNLRLDLAPPAPRAGLPLQNLKVLWNGELVGGASLDRPNVVSLRIPHTIQRLGPNRIDLLPLFWLDPLSAGTGTDPRFLGVKLFEIGFEDPDPEVASPAPAEVIRGALRQKPGSALTWYFALPLRARLRGDLRLEIGDVPTQGLRGRVQLMLLGSAGTSRTLAERSLESLIRSSEWSFDVDLGEHAGQMIALSFVFSMRESEVPGGLASPDLALEWRAARIEGVKEHFPAQDVERLRGRYNVMLILFDTLRPDHTEPYGSTRVRTPAMRRLASRGVTFTKAQAAASWTLPSVASLLTSHRPTAHRMIAGDRTLPEGIFYLPEALRRAGYHTALVTNNPYVSDAFGFERGMDSVHEIFELEGEGASAESRDSPEERAAGVWEDYLEPVVEAQTPFFILLHEIDPHSPYEAPAPYDTLYDDGYQGNITAYRSDLFGTIRMHNAVHDNPVWMGPADVRHLKARYDGEISAMDRYLGWILDRLEERGLRENTLIVFLSDHGEEFLEHGRWGHGSSVYEETLRVPLILSLPGVLPAGPRLETPVTLLDVAPTVLDLLGIPADARLQGRSLLPQFAGADAWRERPLFARSTPETQDSVRRGPWKLIRQVLPAGGYSFELYDLEADPAEIIDRWPVRPVVGHTLRQLLLWQERLDESLGFEPGKRTEPEDDTAQQLRALGYAE